MTDTKRVVLLFEYDDGTRRALEFTDVDTATLNHSGLPGIGSLIVTGRCESMMEFGGWIANGADEPEGLPRGEADAGTQS